MPTKTVLYGHVFEMTDRYAEGHVLTANEATALNLALLEMIGHKLRSVARAEIPDLSKSTVLAEYPEVVEKMNAKLAEETTSYVFGEGRGAGEPRVVLDPVSERALKIADAKVRKAISDSPEWKKVGKKDGSNANEPGVYPWDKFEAKRNEIAAKDAVIAAAKKALAAEAKASSDEDDVPLD